MPDLGAPCRIYCAAPPSRVRLKSRPSVGRRTMPGCAREAQQLMTDTDPSPGTTPWFNTDGGRTIIGAAIVAAFMVIVATVVLVGGQANQAPQNEQPGPTTTGPPSAPSPERPESQPDHGGAGAPVDDDDPGADDLDPSAHQPVRAS